MNNIYIYIYTSKIISSIQSCEEQLSDTSSRENTSDYDISFSQHFKIPPRVSILIPAFQLYDPARARARARRKGRSINRATIVRYLREVREARA